MADEDGFEGVMGANADQKFKRDRLFRLKEADTFKGGSCLNVYRDITAFSG